MRTVQGSRQTSGRKVAGSGWWRRARQNLWDLMMNWMLEKAEVNEDREVLKICHLSPRFICLIELHFTFEMPIGDVWAGL